MTAPRRPGPAPGFLRLSRGIAHRYDTVDVHQHRLSTWSNRLEEIMMTTDGALYRLSAGVDSD